MGLPERLDGRTAAVLRAVVTDYIRTGEPVGSGAIATRYSLGVSSATIRNEMSELEELGYLSHPHTSAGRIPTDLGYRFYVDTLPPDPALPESQRRVIASFFGEAQPDVEEVLRRTASLLSRVTRYVAIAIAPVLEVSHVARADVVEIGSSWVLLLVSDTGRVDKLPLEVGSGTRPQDVHRAAERLVEALGGLSYAQAVRRVRDVAATATGGERAVLLAVAKALERLATEIPEHVFVGGAANLAAEEAFAHRDTLQRLFEALEEQETIHRFLLGIAMEGDVAVRIGREHPLVAMREASTVVAPYRAGVRPAGTVAVIGPTRMAYPTAISVVRTVARRLSDLIEPIAG